MSFRRTAWPAGAAAVPATSGSIRKPSAPSGWRRATPLIRRTQATPPARYADYPLHSGDVFCLDSPGGGGYGDPLERSAERVLADVREGFVSAEAAEREYGVVVEREGSNFVVDAAATQARRAKVTK